jgi:type VI protein secretion system component Hcp
MAIDVYLQIDGIKANRQILGTKAGSSAKR